MNTLKFSCLIVTNVNSVKKEYYFQNEEQSEYFEFKRVYDQKYQDIKMSTPNGESFTSRSVSNGLNRS